MRKLHNCLDVRLQNLKLDQLIGSCVHTTTSAQALSVSPLFVSTTSFCCCILSFILLKVEFLCERSIEPFITIDRVYTSWPLKENNTRNFFYLSHLLILPSNTETWFDSLQNIFVSGEYVRLTNYTPSCIWHLSKWEELLRGQRHPLSRSKFIFKTFCTLPPIFAHPQIFFLRLVSFFVKHRLFTTSY